MHKLTLTFSTLIEVWRERESEGMDSSAGLILILTMLKPFISTLWPGLHLLFISCLLHVSCSFYWTTSGGGERVLRSAPACLRPLWLVSSTQLTTPSSRSVTTLAAGCSSTESVCVLMFTWSFWWRHFLLKALLLCYICISAISMQPDECMIM